ncbi:DNA phosphorothioation-dependent restriction protein DptF [Plebeiibacterium sediminum]|uniref:DNA phosphorothioation-dependent restriction protein DptF n=1 Tax=Plebeiibacterium sediminum TaxID=2992112 RepID=A0AAE3M7Z7_9BACT|nr:DNA phosphorothioation-dependent restriction protein DptF [Plebeiobacterium sediminum]MCW3788495.1 DNA phosphorothioation-dependent restriction protein DptF [Plebeiobacterium sediminum]
MTQFTSFKTLIERLFISSKDSVVDGTKDSTNEFMEYLHVQRLVERKLNKLVEGSYKSEIPQLILVSGNVGDGKSHLLANLFKLYPDEMKEFIVKNDATESQNYERSWQEELAHFLQDFTDEKLKEPQPKPTKAILAINLGTLTNFFENNGNEFTMLSQFVEEYQLLENSYKHKEFKENSVFKHINLADYQIVSVTENGANSEIITDLIKKITTHKDNNPFYKAFIEDYEDFEYKNYCPIYLNYLFLSDSKNQEVILEILIKAIIKDKLIISIRQLLNFIAQLIVPINLQNKNMEEVKQLAIKNSTNREWEYTLEGLIQYMLFERKDSYIFQSLTKQDPCRNRSQKLDKAILKLNVANNIPEVYKEFGVQLPSCIKENITNSIDLEERKTAKIIRLLIRGAYFTNESLKGDKIFESFLTYLFYSYSNPQSDRIKVTNRTILNGIFNWNGSVSGNQSINIKAGQKQNTYLISQELKIKPVLEKLGDIEQDGQLHRYSPAITMAFMTKNKYKVETTIDYSLFELLTQIGQGYRPNREDRQDHLSFEHFITKITRDAGRLEDLSFHHIDGRSKDRYTLSYTDGIGYEFCKEE